MIYGAAWDGEPFRLYRKGPHSVASSALDFPDANLLAISRSGQLAAAVGGFGIPPGGVTLGTLAVAPLEGGAPREIETDVLFADWSPDGRELAVARLVDGRTVLEFPVGKKIYETDGLITFPRVSPKGDLVAFLDHPGRIDNRGTVAVIDRAGRKRTLTEEWAAEQGLAWHPTAKRDLVRRGAASGSALHLRGDAHRKETRRRSWPGRPDAPGHFPAGPRARHARGLAARDHGGRGRARPSGRLVARPVAPDRSLARRAAHPVHAVRIVGRHDLRGLRAEARGIEPDARRRGLRPGAFSGRNSGARGRSRRDSRSSSSVRPPSAPASR